MLSDIFPTGYHGTEMADVGPGDTVVVYGAGPVGLMAAHSAFIRGASRVWVADKEKDRLKLAEEIGAEAIDIADVDPVEFVQDATKGVGADAGVEAVGYQAHDHTGEEHPELVLDNLVNSVRVPGRIGVVGVYVPEDRVRPTTSPPRVASRSSTARCSPRGRRWAPGRLRSSATTANCGT